MDKKKVDLSFNFESCVVDQKGQKNWVRHGHLGA